MNSPRYQYARIRRRFVSTYENRFVHLSNRLIQSKIASDFSENHVQEKLERMKTTTKILRLALILGLVFGAILDGSAQSSKNHLNFSSRGVSLNGKVLKLPCTREEALDVFGEPSGTDYVSPDDKLGSNVIEWSQVGVYAYQKPATGLIHAIGVSISAEHPVRNFEKAFTGRLTIRLANLRLTDRAIRSAGFKRTSAWANWKRTIGDYYMTVVTQSPKDPRELEFGMPIGSSD